MVTSIIIMCSHVGSNMLLSANDVSNTLSTKATALTIICGKFDTTLSEINFKFVLQSLSSILDELVIASITLWGNFNNSALFCQQKTAQTLKRSFIKRCQLR